MSDNPTAEERKCLTGHKARDECPTMKQMGNRASKEVTGDESRCFLRMRLAGNHSDLRFGSGGALPYLMSGLVVWDRVLMCVRQLVSYIRVPIWTTAEILRQQTICKVDWVLAIRFERWFDCCSGVQSIFANAFVLTWKVGKCVPYNAKRWCERFVFDDCWQKESQFFQFRNANWLRIIEGRVAEIEKKSVSRTDWCTP